MGIMVTNDEIILFNSGSDNQDKDKCKTCGKVDIKCIHTQTCPKCRPGVCPACDREEGI